MILSDDGVELERRPLAEIGDTDFAPLSDWWQRARGSRPLPSRRDFDPVEFAPLLSRLILIDVLRDPPDFRYRLAGTQTHDIHGVELTGSSLADLVPRGMAARIWNDLCEMLVRRQPQFVRLRFMNREGSPRDYSVLRLPLSRDGAQVDQVLTIQDFGRDPYQLRKIYQDFRAAERCRDSERAAGSDQNVEQRPPI